ncbi:hypothetical protein [Brevibacillus borstelensis]
MRWVDLSGAICLEVAGISGQIAGTTGQIAGTAEDLADVSGEVCVK